jgi:hypothetical protein
VKKERDSLHTIKWRQNDWIFHIMHRNCPLNTLLRERKKEWEDEEEDVGTYSLTGSTKSHSGELSLEEDHGLVSDRLRKKLNRYYNVEFCRKSEATCRSVLLSSFHQFFSGTESLAFIPFYE